MSVLTLRQIGDPVLRTPSAPVRDPSESRIRSLIADMYLTMDDAQGIGLAAPQVGVSLRIFTWDVQDNRGAVINPQLELSGEPEFVPREPHDEQDPVIREGCLSVRGKIYGPVARHPHAVLSGLGGLCHWRGSKGASAADGSIRPGQHACNVEAGFEDALKGLRGDGGGSGEDDATQTVVLSRKAR